MNIYTLTGEVLLKGTNEAIEELKRLEEQAESTAEKLGKLITNMDANFKASSNITINSLTKVNKSAKTFESDFSKTMNKIGKTLLTVFSAREIIGFAKDVTEASAEVTAEIVAFEQILGGYADTARTKMEEMAKSAGIVSTRLTPHMTNLTAKFKGLGFEMNEATDLAIRGLEMATDAAAFWDFSLEQSMEHLKSFINGNYEGGEAIGLFANETQMAYYGIEKGLIASRKAWIHLDEATKQATRLEFAERMFRQAEITGHAARESQHFANVLANLKESFRQLKASIGDSYLEDALIPAMNSLRNILDDINENVDKFNAWLEDNEVIKHFSELWFDVALEAGTSIGQMQYQFEQFIDWLVNKSFLSPTLKPIVEWTSDSMKAFKKGLETGNWDEVIEEMKNAIPPSLSPIITWGSESVKAFIDALETGDWKGIIYGIENGITLSWTISSLATAIYNAVQKAMINPTLRNSLSMATNIGLAALNIGVKFTDAMEDGEWDDLGAEMILSLLAGILGGLLTGSIKNGIIIFNVAFQFMGIFLDALDKDIRTVQTKISEIKDFKIKVDLDFVDPKSYNELNAIKSTLSEVNLERLRDNPSTAKTYLANVFNYEAGKDLMNQLLEGMKRGGQGFKDIGEEEAILFLEAIYDILEINSPSKAMEKVGNFLVQGLENGVESTESLGYSVGNAFLTGMKDSLDINSPSEEAKQLANFFIDGWELGFDSFDKLGSDIGQLWLSNLYTIVSDNSAMEIGQAIGLALSQGMTEEFEKALDEMIHEIKFNPPVIESTGGSGGTTSGQPTRQNRYNQLTASLEDKEGELEAAMTNLYNARADFGIDSEEAKQAEYQVSFLEQWIANLKRMIDEIENPPSETGFFGGLKNLIDGVNERTDEWKENVGQYIDDFENMFNNASEFVMDFANSFDEIEFTKLEVGIAKLENELKTLEDNNEAALEKAKEKRDEELESLEDQLRNKEICHEEYYEKKKQIEDEFDSLEKTKEEQKEAKEKELLAEKNKLAEKQFNAEKRNQYSNILINTASGIMRAFAENHWIAALGVSAMITAQAIAQKKAVDAQEFVPMLAQGGIVNSATHAIIGEDGREAVVPLERNLEWVDGLARAMSPAIASSGIYSYTPELSSIRSEIVEFRRMVAEYFPQVIEKDTQLSIDGRVLSNAIAPMMDKSLGAISRLKARGV